MGIIVPTKKLCSRAREVAVKNWENAPVYISSSTSPNGFCVVAERSRKRVLAAFSTDILSAERKG